MTCTWAASPRCMLRGLRAHQGVNVHVQGFVCERHTPRDTLVPKTQTTSPTTARFQHFSPRWSALWAPHRLTSRPHHRQSGGIALHEGHHSPLVRASRPPNGGIGIIRGVTRRRHADSQPLILQNPHGHHTMWGHEGPKSLSVGLWVAACIGKPDRNRRSG